MQKFRKENQYYEDRYDQATIDILKDIESNKGDLKKYPLIKIGNITTEKSLQYDITYKDTGALRDQSKKEIIESWKRADEEKDIIIERYNPPPKYNCKKCNVRLHFKDYIFTKNNDEIIFVYDCPKNKKHRKLFFNNGVEYIPQKRCCELCGGKLLTKTNRTKLKLIITDICLTCGKNVQDIYELTPDKLIDEGERKKYCINFKGKLTFYQSMKKIADLKTTFDITEKIKDKRKEFEVEKIEIIKISKLEARLKKKLETDGYLKFKFINTKIDRFVIAEFSVEDNNDREERDSILAFKKIVQAELLKTNWRLMETGLNYKLGLVTGKIKGCDDDESIFKIAKQVKHKSSQK